VNTQQENTNKSIKTNLQKNADSTNDKKTIFIDPDLDFIQALYERSGDSYKKCMQCGTCSATCMLTPDQSPFPRKEMAWAAWGMKKQLISDADIWLCYQCNDCSTRCPRTARPGEIIGAARQECIRQHSFPRFLGRWVNEAWSIPLLLGIPTALLALALYFKEPVEKAIYIMPFFENRFLYSYSHMFPHWLLIGFFGFFNILALLAVVIGIIRFWRALKKGSIEKFSKPVRGLFASILSTLKKIIAHDNFSDCSKSSRRLWSHILVFFGFIALSMVTLWIITASINPLIKDDFVYPFNFWSPWKILANLGGIAVLIGCFIMILDRFKDNKSTGSGNYFDWTFIATLLAVILTGFFTEVLHYVRLEPHRHIVYFIHLVFAFALLIYLPYSKFAHIIYRFTAIVFSERYGRKKN
jgi:quinone-modifying oxidoreductase subunit QmoC